jgi:hypothetical protein
MTRPIVSDKNFEKRIRQDCLKMSGGGIDLEDSSFDPSADCFSKKQYYQYIESGYDWALEQGWYSDNDSDDDEDDDWEEMGGIDPGLAPFHDWDSDPVGFR